VAILRTLRRMALAIAAICPLFVASSAVAAKDLSFYSRSYAVLVGVGRYPSSQWNDLSYARKDAEAMARLLQRQGFEVIELYDERATQKSIVSVFEDYLAPRLARDDRVLVFFSGHGDTQTLGGKDFGYLVPHDASGSRGSMISMNTLRNLSDKMGAAKHHLFIIDACFGGLFAPTKARTDGIRRDHPRYITEVTSRVARQFLTAGGKGQQVLDGGPNGYSYFTGYLLEALEKGLGDLDGDGYITLSELAGYLVPRATNDYQTPGDGTLPGHGLGQFVFSAPQGIKTSSAAPAAPTAALGLKGRDNRAAQQDTLFWQSIKDSENPADYRAYLAQFPNGVFAGLAKNRVREQKREAEAPPPTGPVATQSSPEPKPQSRMSFDQLLKESPNLVMLELSQYLQKQYATSSAPLEVTQIWNHRPPNGKDQVAPIPDGSPWDFRCISFDVRISRNDIVNREGCFLFRAVDGRIQFQSAGVDDLEF